eukprot:scaffold139167_cov18-Tisochrysis_lutea.AAC.1
MTRWRRSSARSGLSWRPSMRSCTVGAADGAMWLHASMHRGGGQCFTGLLSCSTLLAVRADMLMPCQQARMRCSSLSRGGPKLSQLACPVAVSVAAIECMQGKYWKIVK